VDHRPCHVPDASSAELRAAANAAGSHPLTGCGYVGARVLRRQRGLGRWRTNRQGRPGPFSRMRLRHLTTGANCANHTPPTRGSSPSGDDVRRELIFNLGGDNLVPPHIQLALRQPAVLAADPSPLVVSAAMANRDLGPWRSCAICPAIPFLSCFIAAAARSVLFEHPAEPPSVRREPVDHYKVLNYSTIVRATPAGPTRSRRPCAKVPGAASIT